MRIALITSNPHKASEFSLALGGHGQKMISIDLPNPDLSKVSGLLADGNHFVIREATTLVSHLTGQELVAPLQDMELVIHRSSMTVWRKDEKGVTTESNYEANLTGFIDNARCLDGEASVFGWDDIFVPLDAGTDLHALKRGSMKTSARQINIGRFLADHVHFASRLDMQFFPMDQDTTFEFSPRAYEFVTANPYILAGTSGHYLGNMLSHVLSAGIFFRSAASRKEKNYWLPGLNAGIPLTSKKDAVHEITFLFHDLMHFQLPDLIPDVGGEIARQVYVTHRVMGEALTLVLADMIFVDNMRRNGIAYDFSKRLIYPLFESLAVGSGIDGLRSVVKAMSLYAVKGDDTLLRDLLRPGEGAKAALEAFKEKYGRFFIEDLRWTERNFEQFDSQKTYIDKWIGLVGRDTLSDRGLTLLSNFMSEIDPVVNQNDLVDTIFDLVFDAVVIPNAESRASSGADLSVSNAFKRYMIGQMSLFARFGELFDMPALRTKVMQKVTSGDILTPEEIRNLTALVRVYVDGLERRHLIDPSDAQTYRAMHPLFPPFYVFYDAKNTRQARKGSVLATFELSRRVILVAAEWGGR